MVPLSGYGGSWLLCPGFSRQLCLSTSEPLLWHPPFLEFSPGLVVPKARLLPSCLSWMPTPWGEGRRRGAMVSPGSSARPVAAGGGHGAPRARRGHQGPRGGARGARRRSGVPHGRAAGAGGSGRAGAGSSLAKWCRFTSGSFCQHPAGSGLTVFPGTEQPWVLEWAEPKASGGRRVLAECRTKSVWSGSMSREPAPAGRDVYPQTALGRKLMPFSQWWPLARDNLAVKRWYKFRIFLPSKKLF